MDSKRDGEQNIGMKKKIVAVLGLIGAIWILSPLPEVSIIVGYVTGKSLTVMLGLPWYFTWIAVGLSVPFGWFILDEIGVMERVEGYIDSREDIYNEKWRID